MSVTDVTDESNATPDVASQSQPKWPPPRPGKGLGGRRPGAGRKATFREGFLPNIERLASKGATLTMIAEYLGVSRATLFNWKTQRQDVAEALSAGEAMADQNVERAMYMNAVGSVRRKAEKIHVTKDGSVIRVPYVERFKPDVDAGRFWLTNRLPDKWRNKQETDVRVAQVQFMSSILPSQMGGPEGVTLEPEAPVLADEPESHGVPLTESVESTPDSAVVAAQQVKGTNK